MSKTGLCAHFGSKQELQLATVDEAERIFTDEVVQPALAAPLGVAQLAAVCEAFFDHVQRRTFPGRCFFAATALLGEGAGCHRPAPDATGQARSTPDRVCAGQGLVRAGVWGWPGAGSNRRPSDFQSDARTN